MTGKVTGEDGKPQAGVRCSNRPSRCIKWSVHIKTNKKGEYIYIGLLPRRVHDLDSGPDGQPNRTIPETAVKSAIPSRSTLILASSTKEEQKARKPIPNTRRRSKRRRKPRALKQNLRSGARSFTTKRNILRRRRSFEKALPLAKDRNVPIISGRLADTWERAGETETDPDKRKQE